MNVVQPNTTGSQLLKLRIRPLNESVMPLTCSIKYSSGDRWTSGSVTASVAYYDSNDFLNLSASIYIPYDEIYAIEVYQVSASNSTFNKLYQGELLATTASTTIRESEPFESYDKATTEYIIF